VFPAADQVYATDVFRQVYRWDDSGKSWSVVSGMKMSPEDQMAAGTITFIAKLSEVPFPGLSEVPQPVFDPINNFVVCKRLGGLGPNLRSNEVSIVREGVAEALEVGKFPDSTIQLFSSPHGIIAVASSGEIYRMNSEMVVELFKAAEQTKANGISEPDASAGGASGETADTNKSESELFIEMGQVEGVRLRTGSSISYNQESDQFAVYNEGVIKVLGLKDGSYDLKSELMLNLSFDKKMSAMLAFSGKTIAVAFGNGKVISVNAETMVEENEFQLESRSSIRQVDGSPDGRYIGVLFRNGNLWMLDLESGQKMSKVSFSGVKQISTFDLIEDGNVWLGEDIQSATLCNVDDGTVLKSLNPSNDFIQSLYRYAIRPAYTLCPKPSEFYKVVSYLASSSDTSANENVDLRDAEKRGNAPSESPWAPLTSGIIFMLVMLAAGCIVFQTRDY
ncbi:hypothetical protein N9093_01365, partial [bacterium]|nr:hypothetical protein [bacterium]